MENKELIRRAEDLRERCERSAGVTHTGFLSPAERYQLEAWARQSGAKPLFHGGGIDCERCMAFFLPEWMEAETFQLEDYLCAIHLTAHFGSPGHRDYMGALLGMGIGREWLGDIQVKDSEAWIFCQPSVQRHLLGIEKVGRCGVSAEAVPLESVPTPERRVKQKSFSVMSCRLDAVLAGLFDLSRTEAARQIAAGLVQLNYQETFKSDQSVHEGDVISLRGVGKGKVTGTGGTSRKGRLFVYGEVFL